MILTLAGLLQQTKNSVSKKHEVLKVLVSWAVYITNNIRNVPNENNKDQVLEQLDSVRITNSQVKLYLERYNITSCQSSQEYKYFTENTDNYIKSKLNTYSNSQLEHLFDIKIVEKSVLINHKFKIVSGTFDSFVLSSTDNYATILLDLIENETVGESICIQWTNGLKPMRVIYDNYIKNTPYITILLKFERITLKIITNIIISYVVNILNGILNKKYNGNKKNKKCKNIVLYTIDNFIGLLKKSGQPLYLINILVVINKYVWFVCSYMKSHNKIIEITKIMSSLEKIKSKNFKNTGEKKFKRFLNSLSDTLICTIIHPLVTNVLWDKMSFHSFDIFWYTIDYKFIFTKYPNNSNELSTSMCTKIDIMLQTLENSESSKECNSVTNDSPCYNEFHEKINIVYNGVLRIILDDCQSAEECLEWKKIFLTIEYNIGNISHLKPTDNNLWMTERIQMFHTFPLIIKNLLKFRYQVDCSYDESSNKRPGSTLLNNAALKNTFSRPLNASWKDNTKMRDALMFMNFFNPYHILAGRLNFATRMRREHKLYWDGVLKTISDVSDLMNRFTFDPLQDACDFQSFIVKWVVSIVYVGLLDILNDIIVFKHKPIMNAIEQLESSLKGFSEQSFFVTRSIKNNTSMFIIAVKSFDEKNLEDLKYCREILIGELEFFGAPPHLRPNMKDSIASRMKSFAIEVNEISTRTTSYWLPVVLEHSEFVGKNDLIPATFTIPHK